MSDGTDETPTDTEDLDTDYPDVQRSTYARIAAEILAMTRRPSTLFGATVPIAASEIIMLADYIGNGISTAPPVPDVDVDRTVPAGEWVDVEDLRIGDIYRPDEGYDRTPLEVIQIPHYVEIRNHWDITVRPEGGGRVRIEPFPPQSQVEVLVRRAVDEPEGEPLQVLRLRKDDVFRDHGVTFRVVGDPTLTGNVVSIKVRPEPAGIAYLASYDMDSTVMVTRNGPVKPSTALEFGNVAVSDLWVGDLILDYGDGPIEAEKVIRLAPTSFFHTEVTTIDPRLPEETQGAGTRVLSVDKQVTVRYPRVETVPDTVSL